LIRNKIALLRSLYPSNPINPDKGSASQRRHRPWLKLYGEPSLPKQKALTRPPKAVPSSVSVLHTALTLCQGCKASSCSAHPVCKPSPNLPYRVALGRLIGNIRHVLFL